MLSIFRRVRAKRENVITGPAALDLRASRRSRDAWVGFTIFTCALVCCAVVAMYAFQSSAIARVADLGRDLRRARMDLFQGFLHVSLSDSAGSGWDRSRALALVEQGIHEMQQVLPRMRHALPGSAYTARTQAMDAELQVFASALRRTPGSGASQSLELRVSFYRLNALASEVEGDAGQEIDLMRRSQATVFWTMLAGSGGLLAAVCLGTLRASLRVESALRAAQESDLRFRQLAENIGEAFWLRDVEHGSILFVNSAGRALWDLSPEHEATGADRRLQAIHPGDAGRMHGRASGSDPYDEEYRIVRPDGSIRWVRERTFPVQDADGHTYRIAGVAEDITGSRTAESSRAASERRLREVIDLVPHLIYAKDTGGRLLLANRAFAEHMGCERQHLLGRGLEELGVDARHASEMNLQDRRLLANGERIEGLLMDRQHHGAKLTFMVNKMPFRFGDEERDSVLVVATDVTALKRVEAELKQAVVLLEATLESTDNGLMVSDARGSLLLWNKRLAQLLPSPAPLESRFESVVLAALGVGPHRSPAADAVVRRADGGYLESHLQPMVIDGAPAGFVWSFRDVSARELAALEALGREQELQARVTERTRDLAQAYQELESFSHAVSHDLRAPLDAIHRFAHVLLEHHGVRFDPEVRQYIERVLEASQRMREMIDALLELSAHAQAPVKRELLDITRMARSAYELHAGTSRVRSAEFHVQEGLRARGDPVLVSTLLQNLIGNALKYSSRCASARVEVFAEIDAVPRFCVRDNGVGFDPAHASRLFKPFSRLHPSEEFQGHGIGLATAARIVARHGGQIWAEAAPGRGAKFSFTLGPHGQAISQAGPVRSGLQSFTSPWRTA